MSKQPSELQEHADEHPHDQHGERRHPHSAGWPTWLIVAGAIVVGGGLVLILVKDRIAEASAYGSMKTCDVTVTDEGYKRDAKGNPEKQILDGTIDLFPLIRIANQREGVCDVFSLCDTKPQTALRLFRRGLDQGNKNAKVIALSCAVYLAHAQTMPNPEPGKGVLEAEDFERIVAHLDPAQETESDVRKVALRALSDLTVLGDAKAASRYESVPAGVTAPEGRSNTIKTHAETLGGKPLLLIRWSTPELALAWWKQNAAAGKWDFGMQRFVVP